MLKFEPIIKYKKGFVFSLLSLGFAGVLDDELEEKIEDFDRQVFENPDTVGACTFISVLNGSIVGIASYDPQKMPELGIIGFNCVLPEYQGRGFGEAQIKEIIRRFREAGFKKVFVRTGEHPFFAPAQKMYLACGFKESERHPTGDQPGYGTIDYEIELGSLK